MPRKPSTKMQEFCVRLDGEGDERVIKFVTEFCDRWLLVHHITTSENPHFHFYCRTTITQGNFSNKIKSVLGVKGGDYSVKKCDNDRVLEYYSYLFNTKKGNQPRLVSYEGFSPIDVEIYRENANRIAQEFQTRMQNSKKTQHDMCQIVLDRMDPRQVCFPEIVYDEVIAVLKASHTVARPNHVKDMICSVMAFSDNKDAKQKVKDLTLKFFSN